MAMQAGSSLRGTAAPPEPAIAPDDALGRVGVAPERSTNFGAGWIPLAFVALVALRLFSPAGALADDASRNVPAFRGDARRYHAIANESGVPYRDFEVEYPPVTLALVELVDGDTTRATLEHVAIAMFVLDMAALGALAYGWGKRSALAYLALSTPFLFLPFVYFRIDLLAVALAMWGLALARRRHELGGGVLLALSVFAKLWPLAVLPALIAARRGRALGAAVVTGALGAAVWLAVGGVAGFEQVLTFRGAKGWQIESVVGGAVRAVTGATPHTESGALRAGDAPVWATILLGILMLAVVAWIWWRVIASGSTDDAVVYGVAPLVATMAFLVCSPLLSPQFMIWLVPFGAICWASGLRVYAWTTGALVVLTMVLTQAYPQLNDDEVFGHAVLLARNSLLVGATVFGLVWLARWSRVRTPA
jgi:hypothetical protein